ncbi:PadR family transcriptional regulator [Streptomyces sp. NPDC101175]|uniref:PadR family transcriptional regulator n=1 Tax=Streptomyces sp. NPDC101175 TaxID=3366123 RepID=UPI003833AF16
MPPIRLTQATIGVLNALFAATPDRPAWGLSICQEADLGSGTVYPILDRLVSSEWITSWEEDAPHPGRPPRRYYELTSTGRKEAQEALARRASRRRFGLRHVSEGGTA